jgi:hydroxybutyrate-dimer hydrolase
VYGAIATAGEWGLKRGCAVAYTDKGTGNGVHDLASDTVTLIDGRREAAASAGARSHFTAKLTAAELVAFNAASPNRLAVKHAHSEQNPERDWGEQVIQSVRFAFYVLNEKFGARGRDSQVVVPVIRKARTIVIASSVSNGGGASLRAAERDLGHWIDGIAVAEPNVQPFPNPFVSIERDGKPVAAKGRALYDYFTSANLLQACAAWAPSAAASPGLAFVVQARASNRCAALKAAGLINGDTFADQAADALAQLRAAGWEPESDLLHASHYAFATPAVAVTYAKTYGRASVADSRCGFSFAATGATGGPAPVAPIVLAQIFGNGNGIPPMGAVAPASGINIVNDNSLGGPLLDSISFSPKGVQDFNTDGAFCLRSLFTGTNADGSALAGAAREAFERTRQGIREVRATGFLFGKPAIIVHGRADTLVPVNHSSRPYYASNRALEGRHSGLRYYEITNAQHFDAFLGNALLAGYDTRFVPLHRYFVQAMDLMWHHLKQGAPLPPSQVVRTVPRGGSPGAAPAITAANVPPIVDNPTADNLIKFANRTLSVPE